MTDAATEARALLADEYALSDSEYVRSSADRIRKHDGSSAEELAAIRVIVRALSTPTPARELREVVRTADYLIERYKDLWLGKSVRDLAEAHGAYDAAVARALAQPGSGEGV